MSQYPPPYSQPPVQQNYGYDFSYYQSQDDVLAPAKRASVLMFVLGGLVLLPSCCCGVVAFALPAMMAQQPGAFSDLSAAGMTVETTQVMLGIGGGVALLMGVTMIVLGRFVRRGSMGAAVTASVLAALIVLYLLINGLGIMVMSGKLPPAQVVMGIAMTVIGLVVFGMLILWLIQAAMAAPRVAMMKSQYQQQLWQYQQQQQMYQAGYVPPPMPPMHQHSPQSYGAPMPPPVPPPPPSDTSSPGDPNGPSA